MLKAKDDDQVYTILKRKYFKNKSFAQAEGKQGSQFWKGIMKTRNSVKWGLTARVGNGKNVLFWEEVWVLDIPLRLEFLSLFDLCKMQKVVVVDHCNTPGVKHH